MEVQNNVLLTFQSLLYEYTVIAFNIIIAVVSYIILVVEFL